MILRPAAALAATLLTAACATPAPPPLLAPPSVEAPPFLRTFAKEKEPHPTVLLIPGCETPLISSRAALFERYAKRLRDEGFAAAIVDYPGAASGDPACVSEATPSSIAGAIDRALTGLKSNPAFDLKRVHLVGWSHGAAGVLAMVRRQYRQPGLVSAAALYTACPKPEAWKTDVTLFLLLGEKDTIAPPAACREWADNSDGPGPIVINRYVGVGHGFDVGEAADPAYAAYLRADFPLAFDASTAHQAWIDMLKFLRLDLPAGS